MGIDDQRARYVSVTAGARGFALILLAGPVSVTGDVESVRSLILLAAVWIGAVFADGVRGLPVMPSLVVETSLVTFLVGLSLGQVGTLLPALLVPAFVGGLVRGVRGAFEVLGAEVVILAAATLPNDKVAVTRDLVSVTFTWLMVSLGAGLIAAVVHRARSESTTTSSYRDARVLINSLLELSGDLVDGLDPVSISQNILDYAREELPLAAAAVYVRSEHGTTTVADVHMTGLRGMDPPILDEVFNSGKQHIEAGWAAFPLVTDAGVVAVVAGPLIPGTPWDATLEAALSLVVERLRHEGLRLDTALLFSAVRDQATAEERRRLARDLHDGVAQDLASLGYMLDELAETADSFEQAARCRELRRELTDVVAELRRSVSSLRNESDEAETLGARIQALAVHIEFRAGVPIEVVLDESAHRLHPDVEQELLRIAQEGMNNAVKHARARLITVTCRVHPPHAEITVCDDGRGLQSARDDSHGVMIMRERARRIGAELQLSNAQGAPGTVLRVNLGTTVGAASRP